MKIKKVIKKVLNAIAFKKTTLKDLVSVLTDF
jgi:hypothetical protein